MDDDVRMVGALLTEPEPSPEAVDRSRHRLQRSMRQAPGRPARRRRTRWLAGGLAVVGTAAAAVIVVDLSAPTTHPGRQPALVLASGRQILLAAADTAESQPATTGTYWHTKMVFQGADTHRWIRRDGRMWFSVKPGLISRFPGRYTLRNTDLDFAAIRSLPTEPDALKAKLLSSTKEPAGKRENLIRLLNEVLGSPAPPPVRAAAFRVLADIPGIRNLGKVDGGQALEFTLGDNGHNMLVVDPKTTWTRVLGYDLVQGKRHVVSNTVVTRGWTNTLPGRLVPFEVQLPKPKPPA